MRRIGQGRRQTDCQWLGTETHDLWAIWKSNVQGKWITIRIKQIDPASPKSKQQAAYEAIRL